MRKARLVRQLRAENAALRQELLQLRGLAAGDAAYSAALLDGKSREEADIAGMRALDSTVWLELALNGSPLDENENGVPAPPGETLPPPGGWNKSGRRRRSFP